MDFYKGDFPVFKNSPGLVYVDSASSALKPQIVIDSITNFYQNSGVNVHRGAYRLSAIASNEYESSRKVVADFVGADENEIVFTSGATAGINMIAHSFSSQEWKPGDKVIVTEADHHSNWLIWQQLSKTFEVDFCIFSYPFDQKKLESLLTSNTKLFCFPYISNVLGTIFPVEQWIRLAQEREIPTLVDASQAPGHIEMNFTKLGADFLVFSGHKMFGPTGIGVLVAKKYWLTKLIPSFLGGGTVSEVTSTDYTLLDTPQKWEPGTPNISGAIGVKASIGYINTVTIDAISQREKQLYSFCLDELSRFSEVRIMGKELDFERIPIFSFVIDAIHAHDIATVFDMDQICVRAGHHCAKPLLCALGVSSLVRISFSAFYNEEEDIVRIGRALQHCRKIYF